jgi:hypothetical protein
MAKTFTNIASNFSGTHEDLMELMSKARTQKSLNSLDKLTVKELRELAKNSGLKGYSTLNKADLIALIIEESGQ